MPRWSVPTGFLLRSVQSLAASMATLPTSRACVLVGPPLSASGPRLSCAAVTCVKPGQVPLVVKLTPVALNVPMLAQSPPEVLMATMEFLMFITLAAPLTTPPPLAAEFAATVTKLRFAALPVLAMPPPELTAELPDTVLLIIVSVPLLLRTPPPPPAEFPESVLFVIVTAPPLLYMPPPPEAELPDSVLLLIVIVLFCELKSAPPTESVTALFDSTTLSRFSVAKLPLKIAPPVKDCPSLMVRLEMLTVMLLRISNTREA